MPTSSITDRFVLDDKRAERLIEIIENTKAHILLKEPLTPINTRKASDY